jgi:hypothetical protein
VLCVGECGSGGALAARGSGLLPSGRGSGLVLAGERAGICEKIGKMTVNVDLEPTQCKRSFNQAPKGERDYV